MITSKGNTLLIKQFYIFLPNMERFFKNNKITLKNMLQHKIVP